MHNKIASLLGLSHPADSAEIVSRPDLGRALGVPQSEALRMAQSPDFPAPIASPHRRVPGETLSQPQPGWDRAELERWLEQQTASR